MNPIEKRAREIGERLLWEARERRRHFWAREHWEEGLLQQFMRNERFRTQALRFVDVLPALRSDDELTAHVQEYFGRGDLPLPVAARWGIEHSDAPVISHVVAAAVRTAMHGFAGRFVGGESPEDVTRAVRALRKEGMAFTLDLLGEATLSESEADLYRDRCLELLATIGPRVSRWKPSPLLDRMGGRPCPILNLSVKVSALSPRLTPLDPEGGADAVLERLLPICRAARQQGAFICLDMEQFDLKDTVFQVLRRLMSGAEFAAWPDLGIAVQAYLRETESDLAMLRSWAEARGTPVTVRLVRGAYWDYETILAAQNGWASPVWLEKPETDRCYERCLRFLVDSHPALELAAGTHNVRSLALAVALAEAKGLPPDSFELQMLYGMADPLKDALAGMGHRVRVYVPFGEVIPGMAYLVRRLLENTASQSFLRLGFAEDVAPDELLAPPPEPEPAPATPAPAAGIRASAFRNEPVRRFTDEAERSGFRARLEETKTRLGRRYLLHVMGREFPTGRWLESVNPAAPSQVIGLVAEADTRDADAAVDSAAAAFREWSRRPAADRAAVLSRAAELMRGRRDELAAWEVLEAGKTWQEADADVVEAIDFLGYYASEALQLADPRRFDVPGETNQLLLEPVGVWAVLPPWNFPLAILTGLCSAVLAAGNTAVLKPAHQTPVIACHFVRLMAEAGLPPGALNLLFGPGARVGEHLVRHPRVHGIAFTGSRAVGCRINQVAAEVQPGQLHLKPVVAEMGGKNGVIVDADADVDDAVSGCLASAFGFQGQKCSAASRIITVGSVHELFLHRFVEAARSLVIGDPEDPAVDIGPVIDAAARDRILAAVEAGRASGRLALQRDAADLGDGYFVGPTIFSEVDPRSALAQEEIFGPVTAVIRAADFDEALRIANDTAYALTGGVYSRSPGNLETARREFDVGNLYFNRKITGAIVGRQPFGGFRMSGTGPKAGGPDTLLRFLEARTVTENQIRRGFAPAALD